MEKLSKKQNEVLRAVKKFIAKNSYPPSVRDLCKILKLNSTATVHYHLNILIEKGYLKTKKGGKRTLEVIGENEYLTEDENVSAIPLVGRASCGNLIEAVEAFL